MAENRLDLSAAWKRLIAGKPVDFVPVPGSYAPVGECVLETEFDCPWGPAEGGARDFLCTEGVLASAEFTLNGQPIGRAGPWTPYRFELPHAALRERNLLQARVRDVLETFGPPPGRRFDGGLIREVWIERRPACFVEHVAFRAELNEDCSAARVTVQAQLNGPAHGRVECVLIERDTGRRVAQLTAPPGEPLRFEVEWPKLWSPEFPNCYALTVRLDGQEPDEAREVVGFRKLEIRGRDFFLNNRRLVLKGVCRHEFIAAHGYSPPVEAVRQELARIRYAGFNYVRLVHSPQAPCVARLAAELGLLVSEEPGACFHDLADEKIVAPALESLRRLVLRDRNCPSVLAWLIYNECNPNAAYAVRAAQVCRELDPGGLLSFADCSGQNGNIRAMLETAGLSFYGINIYSFGAQAFTDRMKVFTDRPMLLTEWGGWCGQGNPRVLESLCRTFARHVLEDEPLRIAGCSFWAWADYEERSRGGPAAPEGHTIEGLVDVNGALKPDLLTLSNMCFEMDHPPPVAGAAVEVLARAVPREGRWRSVPLSGVAGDQSHLEREIAEGRKSHTRRVPVFGRLLVAGIEFDCRGLDGGREPLLLGRGREEIVIPVKALVRRVAVLGHVALKGGYPSSALWTVHHGAGAAAKELGAPASEYEFVFEDGTVTQPLLHGVQILRANNICRWWTTAPRSPETAPAVQAVLDPAYEVLRFDLWEKEFSAARRLEVIRWRLKDADSIQALLAVSVRTDG